MSPRLARLPRYEPGSPQWHEQRALSIGGSEIAAVMGISPWNSPFSLWHQKKALVPQNIEDNEPMYWGRAHEAAIATRFAAEHPEWKVRRTPTFQVIDRPEQLVSADRDVMIGPRQHRPLEIKHSRDSDGWGKPGTDDIPIYYRTQGIWQADILGADLCYFAVLIAGMEYREYIVEKDDTEAAILREEARKFRATLIADVRPPIDSHGATYTAVKNLHPQINDDEISLDRRLAEHFVRSRLALKAAEAEAQLATSLVADRLGNGKYAKYGEATLARRQSRGDGTPYLVAAPHLDRIDLTEKAA